MKKIISIMILTFIIGSLYSQSYKNYHENRYKAEDQIFKNDFDSALYYYDKAFSTVDYILVRELYNVSVIAAVKNDSSLFVSTMCKAISQGLELSTGIAKENKYIRKYNKKLNYVLNTKYDSCHAIYLETYKLGLKDKLVKMETADQKCRKAKPFSWDSIVKVDSINIMKLKAIINKYGFPGEEVIGYCNRGYFYGFPTDIIVHHSSEDELPDSIMIKAIYEGRYSPFQYALRYDYHHTNYTNKIKEDERDSVKAYYILFSSRLKDVDKKTISIVNNWRSEILLNTVEHSFKRKKFKNRKYRFIFY